MEMGGGGVGVGVGDDLICMNSTGGPENLKSRWKWNGIINLAGPNLISPAELYWFFFFFLFFFGPSRFLGEQESLKGHGLMFVRKKSPYCGVNGLLSECLSEGAVWNRLRYAVTTEREHSIMSEAFIVLAFISPVRAVRNILDMHLLSRRRNKPNSPLLCWGPSVNTSCNCLNSITYFFLLRKATYRVIVIL